MGGGRGVLNCLVTVNSVHTSLCCSVVRQENILWPSSCSRARA